MLDRRRFDEELAHDLAALQPNLGKATGASCRCPRREFLRQVEGHANR